jgi:cytochrome P450
MPVILSMRQATEDVRCGTIPVPRGTVLWMWWGAGCMDPAAYAGARTLPAGAAPDPRAPVFGAGAHACLGHALIRTVALPLIAGAFGGGGHLVADGPARPSQPWRLSRLPQQRVVWSGTRQA